MPEQPPSWWEYIGGRETDKRSAQSYVALVRRGAEISDLDLMFYLAAVERLAKDDYPPPSNHRPRDPVNFWLACYYYLRLGDLAPKAAASVAADVAKSAGIAPGHDAKAIQGHARKLGKAITDFIDALVAQLKPNLPAGTTKQQVEQALNAWVEKRVREAAGAKST